MQVKKNHIRCKKACAHCYLVKAKCNNQAPCQSCIKAGVPCVERMWTKRIYTPRPKAPRPPVKVPLVDKLPYSVITIDRTPAYNNKNDKIKNPTPSAVKIDVDWKKEVLYLKKKIEEVEAVLKDKRNLKVYIFKEK